MSVTVTATFSHDDELKAEISQLRTELMSLKDEIVAEIQAMKNDAATEHEQVTAAIGALEAKIVNSVTEDEKAEIMGLFAEARSAIRGVYEPPVVEEPPPSPEV